MTPPRKKRGGQSKHWAEEARVWTWYRYIKSKSNLSDYQLDKLFAWTEKDLIDEDTDDRRPRTFEWIRKKARKPKGVKNKWRTMENLVVAVDQDERFSGSKTLYCSNFWTLLQNSNITHKEVVAQLANFLSEFELVRANPLTSKTVSNLVKQYGRQAVIHKGLLLSIKRMEQIESIIFLWLVNLLSRSRQAHEIWEITESMFDEKVLLFFEAHFKDEMCFEYYALTMDAFMRSRVDNIRANFNQFGYSEIMNEWPIFPKSVIDDTSGDEGNFLLANFKPSGQN